MPLRKPIPEQASYALLKSLVSGNEHWLHAGGVPIFLTVTGIWCTSISLKYLWPTLTFSLGAFACLYGSAWYHEALARVHKITMDPFVVALLVWAGGLALCAGAILQTILWLFRYSKKQKPESN